MSDGEIQIGAGTLYTLLPRLEKELYIHLENTAYAITLAINNSMIPNAIEPIFDF